MARSDTHPHILIDVLFRLRKRLDAKVWATAPKPPLLLTSVVPGDRSLLQSRPRSIGFGRTLPPLDEPPSWGWERRDAPFFPTRLILDWEDRTGSGTAKRSKEVQALLSDSTRQMRGLLTEARDFFGLEPGEPLRIACAGCRTSLFVDSVSFDAQLGQAATRLRKKGSAHYARQLARALESLGPVELVWLGDVLPASPRFLWSGKTGPVPWRMRRLARRVQADMAREHGAAGASGSVSMLYYRRLGFWRRYAATAESTEDLLNQFAGDRPRTRASVLVVAVPLPGQTAGRLDNPILTRPQLELATSAGIRSVLLDERCGILFDRDLDEPAPRRSKGKNPRRPPGQRKPPALPPIYRF